MNVLIMEPRPGLRVTFYKASPAQWEGQYSTLDDFLLDRERGFNSQGVITHGLIDEADIPPVPEGGVSSDLYWDVTLPGLAYGDTNLKASLLNQRDRLLDASGADLLLAMEHYHHESSYDNRLIVQDNYVTSWKNYRDELRGLDADIAENPYFLVFPKLPLFAEPTLDDYKKNKLNDLQMEFNKEQSSGITSGVLGADHQYDTGHHNLEWVMACTLLTLTSTEIPLITCDDMQGNEDSKQQRAHDGSQCSQLLSDGMTSIQVMKEKLADLKTDVDNAVDEAAVDAIIWP